MPFQNCDNSNLLSFEDLKDESILKLDPFDLLCKNLKNIKNEHTYDLLNTELNKNQNILALIENKDHILKNKVRCGRDVKVV